MKIGKRSADSENKRVSGRFSGKSVWLGCVRAKGCGLWKLYTTTGCNQTNDNSNIII